MLREMFENYCWQVCGFCNDEIIKKETKKLKREIPLYNFFKGAQFMIFMHFH